MAKMKAELEMQLEEQRAQTGLESKNVRLKKKSQKAKTRIARST